MFHLHIRYLSKDGGGSAEGARLYLAREGRYAKRGDIVRWVHSLNMPTWAATASAEAYWQAAISTANRENARTAVLIEFAIPKLLPKAAQNDLALAFAGEMTALMAAESGLSEVLPSTMGFHEGYGRNPHLHLLVSTSILDGLDRDAKSWFRRFNPKDPSKGGAKRSALVTKKGWLFRVRELWATMANKALLALGLPATVDHRSHAARGLTTLPGLHLGPTTTYLRAQGISTPRSERLQDIVDDNVLQLELEERIRVRKTAIARLKLEIDIGETADGVWRRLRTENWRHLLAKHPFAAPQAALVRHANALVAEADGPNKQLLAAAPYTREFLIALRKAVGVDWDATAVEGGLWLVRPTHDSVVVVRQGYAATDGVDSDSIAAVIKAAGQYAYVSPLLAVRRAALGAARAVLLELGLKWKVSLLPEPESDAGMAPRVRM